MQRSTDLTGGSGGRTVRLGTTSMLVAIVLVAVAILVATIALGPVEPTSESVVMAPWRW